MEDNSSQIVNAQAPARLLTYDYEDASGKHHTLHFPNEESLEAFRKQDALRKKDSSDMATSMELTRQKVASALPLKDKLRSRRIAEKRAPAAFVGRRDPAGPTAMLDDFSAVCPLEVNAAKACMAGMGKVPWNATALAGFLLSAQETGIELTAMTWFSGLDGIHSVTKVRFRHDHMYQATWASLTPESIDGMNMEPEGTGGWRSLDDRGVLEAVKAVLESKGIVAADDLIRQGATRAGVLLSRIAAAEKMLIDEVDRTYWNLWNFRHHTQADAMDYLQRIRDAIHRENVDGVRIAVLKKLEDDQLRKLAELLTKEKDLEAAYTQARQLAGSASLQEWDGKRKRREKINSEIEALKKKGIDMERNTIRR